MHRIIRTKAYEAKHGPHFDDEHARKAVSKMENEDGSKGQHWSLEETSALANQYGIRFDDKFNKYDWYVALNMVYSDYYRVIVNMTGSNNAKYFVELAKAWLCDKDIDEGKMWYYYIYIMCDKLEKLKMNSSTETTADMKMMTMMKPTVTFVEAEEWEDLHMVDVENMTENTTRGTMRRRKCFPTKMNSNVVVLCATLDINQIKSILNKINNYVRR